MEKISSCLWFNNQAEEAARFYVSLFKNSKISKVVRYGESASEVSGQKKGSVMTVDFEIEEQNILGLNGGPQFKFTPALSFFVWCETEREIDQLWKNLTQGGTVRMELDTYPFAQKYGWVTDKFGVEWQFMLSNHKQKIAPCLLFVDKLFGKGEEAMNFYMSLFDNSKVEFMARNESTNTIAHAVFSLNGQNFVLMEGQGNHNYSFSNAFSLVINCDTQQEIDLYWTKLSEGGQAGQCGWLTDKYGIAWQVVPKVLEKMISDTNTTKSEKVMKAMLTMQKLDIKDLEQAYF
ncbi:MAG: VOC family protein [Pseudobdellovibrionaceae bacterium]